MPRLFAAVALPRRICQALSFLNGGVPGAHWAGEDQFHITLRFVGEVDGPTASDVADALADIGGAPFTLGVRGVGHFDKGRTPTVLWAGVENAAPLFRLHEKIDRAMVRLGLPADPRKYHPHVTLARLKGAYRDRVGAFLAAHAGFDAGTAEVRSFHLYSSHRGQGGAVYRIEETYPLADGLREAAPGGTLETGA